MIKRMKDLTKGNTFKTLFKFAIPLIIAGVIGQTYNLVDLMVAGKAIGSDALAATGASTALVQLLSSLFWGFGVASSAYVGILFGEKKNKEISRCIKTIIIFIAVSMLLICTICFFEADLILRILKVDEAIIEPAKVYFRIYLVSLFIQSFNYTINCMLQGVGISKFPMITTLISGLGNLLLNILFVVVFKWGIEGLAWATVLSTTIATIMGFVRIILLIKELKTSLKPEFDFIVLRKVLKLAIPCILQQCSMYIAGVVVQPVVNLMGKAPIAGYSIALNVYNFINAFFHNISRSCAAYSSQSLGSEQYDNFTKGIKISFIQQLICAIPIVIAFVIFPNSLYSLFLKDNDPSVLPYAVQFSYVCMPFILFCIYGNLMHSFYKSVKAVNLVLIETIIFSICRIAFTYLLPFEDPLFNVYLAYGLSWLVEAIILFIAYLTPVWQTKEVREYFQNKKNKLKAD